MPLKKDEGRYICSHAVSTVSGCYGECPYVAQSQLVGRGNKRPDPEVTTVEIVAELRGAVFDACIGGIEVLLEALY